MNWIKIGSYLLLILPALFFGVILGFYLIQDYLIFLGERLPQDHPFSFNLPFEELNFVQPSGIQINAVYFKTESPAGLIYYHHGNAGNLQGWGGLAINFTKNKYDVLFYDYRGYGKSSGKIKREHQLHNDAAFVLDEFLKSHSYDKIVYYGTSLGTGIASKLATRKEPFALILETPYYSFTDLVRHHYPFLPATWLTKYYLRNYRFLSAVNCPVLIFHGTNDEIIPYASAQRLAELSKNITLVTINGGVHNNLPDFKRYQAELKGFLERL